MVSVVVSSSPVGAYDVAVGVAVGACLGGAVAVAVVAVGGLAAQRIRHRVDLVVAVVRPRGGAGGIAPVVSATATEVMSPSPS